MNASIRLPVVTWAALAVALAATATAAHAASPAPAAPAAAAAPVDRADLDPTKIIGNRELPKVLYIVPWRKPMPTQLSGRPVDSVLDEVLAPVDRDVFRRQVQYDAAVHPREAPKKQ